jgi:hypothetical protein
MTCVFSNMTKSVLAKTVLLESFQHLELMEQLQIIVWIVILVDTFSYTFQIHKMLNFVAKISAKQISVNTNILQKNVVGSLSQKWWGVDLMTYLLKSNTKPTSIKTRNNAKNVYQH